MSVTVNEETISALHGEAIAAIRQRQLARMRFNYLFAAAWRSIAEERGYRYDVFLTTSSHGTLALRSHLIAMHGM